jgi:hypothetical protein
MPHKLKKITAHEKRLKWALLRKGTLLKIQEHPPLPLTTPANL